MTPIERRITGRAVFIDLSEEQKAVKDELAAVSARVARTLVKIGALRATLIGIKPGGEIREHTAVSPITIHVLDGVIDVESGGERWSLSTGMLLALDAGVPHAVHSTDGGTFLLTLTAPPGP